MMGFDYTHNQDDKPPVVSVHDEPKETEAEDNEDEIETPRIDVRKEIGLTDEMREFAKRRPPPVVV